MHPYKSLPPHAFWRQCVGADGAFEISDIWDPKFPISRTDKISTYGSCFAQHIGKALVANGFNWFCTEPAIAVMSDINNAKFGYGLFSSRTGNIYTTSQMLQWTEWAKAPERMPNEIWEKNGRFYDALRPTLEPDGFASKAEIETARRVTRGAFMRSVVNAQVFVFTLGLTESWFNKKAGFEYGICPSPSAFDEENHEFLNMSYREVEAALQQSIANLRAMNPNLKILLTVSPVPLVATAAGGHVLAATTHSKSILRAVSGQAALDYDFVDYFPSYEIINNPGARGGFFEPNMRTVSKVGVARVMEIFFDAQNRKFMAHPSKDQISPKPEIKVEDSQSAAEDVVCEEELLAAFGDKK